MFYCSLSRNTYLMLQDKKIKGSAKNYNKINRKKKFKLDTIYLA